MSQDSRRPIVAEKRRCYASCVTCNDGIIQRTGRRIVKMPSISAIALGLLSVLRISSSFAPKSSRVGVAPRTSRQSSVMFVSWKFWLAGINPENIEPANFELDDLLNPNITAVSIEQARKLLSRAKELREEARTLELALDVKKTSILRKKDSEFESKLSRIFPTEIRGSSSSVTPQTVANRIQEERFSEDDVVSLLDEMYSRRKIIVDSMKLSLLGNREDEALAGEKSPSLQFSANQTKFDQFSLYMQYLSDAVAILDETYSDAKNTEGFLNKRWSGRGSSMVRSRLNEWRRTEEIEFQRSLSVDVQMALKGNAVNTTIQNYIAKSLGFVGTLASDSQSEAELSKLPGSNATQILNAEPLVPLWVPSSLLGFVLSSRSAFETADVRVIKEKILSKSSFFCTSSDSISNAAVFRGNFRPPTQSSIGPTPGLRTHTAIMFEEIRELMEKEGLSQRIQLFLLEDPEWRPDKDAREKRPKPVILAIPNAVKPDESEVKQSLASIILRQAVVALALSTTFTYSVSCYALNPTFFDAIVNKQNLKVILACLPIFVGILALQTIHELAHLVVARRRGMKIGWPFPLPSSHIGIFGCITPLRSFPPDRSALLDFALSGPVAGFVCSVALMVIGSINTVYATQAALQRFPVIPIALLKSSFLAGSILTYLLPKAMMLPQSQPIPIHPLFMIGFAGALASALNMLPIFRLDGGRACTAALGHRLSELTSAWTLLCLLSFALSGSNLAWAWGGLVVLFQRRTEIPARDDVTVVSDARIGVWIASLVATIMALAPFPGGTGML